MPGARAYAARHASECAEISPECSGASLDMGIYPGPYARAHLLIQIVGSWKATEMRVSGSPKPLVPVQSMIKCARGWLRRAGACRAAFPAGPWPKCELWCRRFDSFRGTTLTVFEPCRAVTNSVGLIRW